ncbi:MAG: class I SAM-dependent methyltransferase [Nanoarchaeota archaeon]
MATLLVPGRHILTTRFQDEYLRWLLSGPVAPIDLLHPNGAAPTEVDTIIFALTSANHPITKYNPFPASVRRQGLERFVAPLAGQYLVRPVIVDIPHFDPTPSFAERTLEYIADRTEGEFTLSPQDTIVLCSTPAVLDLYQRLGFAIAPAELESVDQASYRALTPAQVFAKVIEAGDDWRKDRVVVGLLSQATLSLWRDEPWHLNQARRIFTETLVDDEGGLTDSRDYDVYAYAMGKAEVIDYKYEDIRPHLRSGVIVDEGCADGALLQRIARDFPDADLYGVDISAEMIVRVNERLRRGAFGESHVDFKQGNILRPLFPPASIDVTISNSTIHEVESYTQDPDAVTNYLRKVYDQTKPGGTMVIRDVIGPEDPDRQVYMLLQHDGKEHQRPDPSWSPRELSGYLGGLSAFDLFRSFAEDFQSDLRDKGIKGPQSKVEYGVAVVDGKQYVVTSFASAHEFMMTKEYLNNWRSEMNERFAVPFSVRRAQAERAGWSVLENHVHPELASRVYTSDFIRRNWWDGKVSLYVPNQDKDGRLEPLGYGPTNMVMVLRREG